jgi:hypothetical protein
LNHTWKASTKRYTRSIINLFNTRISKLSMGIIGTS